MASDLGKRIGSVQSPVPDSWRNHLAKVRVASSNLVARSREKALVTGPFLFYSPWTSPRPTVPAPVPLLRLRLPRRPRRPITDFNARGTEGAPAENVGKTASDTLTHSALRVFLQGSS